MTIEEVSRLLKEKGSNTTVVKGGIGPLSLLGIALVILKATGYITWSWLWVLAPFWIPVAIAVLIVLAFLGLLFGLVLKEEHTLKPVKVTDNKVEPEKTSTSKKAKKSETKVKDTSKEKKDEGNKGKNE